MALQPDMTQLDDACFEAFGESIAYTAAGGAAAAVTAVVDTEDATRIEIGDAVHASSDLVVHLRLSDVADPKIGDELTIDGLNYVVIAVGKDRTVARLTCRRAAKSGQYSKDARQKGTL